MQYMSGHSESTDLTIIFIGKYLSPSEIHIEKLPTLYDVYYHTCKKFSLKEQQNFYQYKNIYDNDIISFYYDDGMDKKSGKIFLHENSLQIKMDLPPSTFCNYFLIQRGKKVSFLTYPPNCKIKLEYIDTSMICAEELYAPLT
ncbi:MAG TPA: hypothetical protein VEV44_07085 [Pseudoneobacillus sp.]|nr:hypothetical protein [Pseudoneobacillus sp.]